MREETHIERKRFSDARIEGILVGALRGKRGAITRADAVALTGLPADETDTALRSLLSTYRSHLAVTDDGELLYSFDPAMARRDAVPLKERFAAIGRALWKTFTFLFKIWIVVTLVFYVAAFAAMAVALIVGSRGSSDRNDRRRGGDGFGFPWLLWWMMPDWAPPEQRRRMVRRGNEKRFYLSVFDFVFGPRSPATDPLGAEKEMVGYLRAFDGRITATDLVSLTGWSFDRAEEEATRLLADFDGEPEITPEGTIVYSFPELRKTAGETERGAFHYVWQERQTPPPVTGNGKGTNAAIAVMNGFNLVSALAIGPAFLARYGLSSDLAELFVTWFPLAFSGLFFAVPGARLIAHRRREHRFAAAVARASLLHVIIEQRGAPMEPAALCERAGRGGPSGEVMRAALERLLVDLEGDIDADDAGLTRYSFPRIGEEIAAVERARALAPKSEVGAGTVVFSSNDPPSPPLPSPSSSPRLN